MGRQWNQIIESLGPLTGGTMSINANLTDIEALLTTLQADVADGITVSSGTVTANVFGLNPQGLIKAIPVAEAGDDQAEIGIPVVANLGGAPQVIGDNYPLPISGTVTADSNRGSLTAASTQSITTGGAHQQVFASNASRKFLLVQNLSDTDMYLGIGFNPSNTTPDGILLSKSGGGIVFESSYIPTQEIRIVCATTGKRFEALEA